MASLEASAPSIDHGHSDSPSLPLPELHAEQSQQVSSTPIEMNPLSASAQSEQQHTSIFGPPPVQAEHNDQPATTNAVTTAPNEHRQIQSDQTPKFLDSDPHRREISPSNNASAGGQPAQPQLTRMETTPAIGPATDKPTPIMSEAPEGPVLFITLLLASTGARHPYKLDGKYLRKRHVEVEGNNPINMSLYKLKELILRDWRSEWDAKPSSPESIRLIFMGKMLNDKSRLADNGFTNSMTPQIVHMAIKPQEIVDEEEANKAVGKDRDGNDRSPGCRCVIQ